MIERPRVSLFKSHSSLQLKERRHWPVLEANGRILWVKCFGPAAEAAATVASRAVVRLTYY